MDVVREPRPGPVTPADVDRAVDLAAGALRGVLDRAGRVPAGDLAWDCWETVEHVADDLFFYAVQLGPRQPRLDTHVPFGWRRQHPDGPANTIYADAGAEPAELVRILEACGALLSAMAATTPPSVRSYHIFGASDPEGFAAMGVVEVLAHLHDVARGLDFAWAPPADLCDRALGRLFPAAPTGPDRWATLLWATGRGDLPGLARRTSWQWDGRPRAERTGDTGGGDRSDDDD